MSDFIISIESDNNNIDILNTSQIVTNSLVIDPIVQIEETGDTTVTIECCVIDNISNLEIIKYNDYDLVLTNTVYANLPDEIPMSIITGNLSVGRIDGLDEYLDSYAFDCGSP